jgi:hypothetical protein
MTLSENRWKSSGVAGDVPDPFLVRRWMRQIVTALAAAILALGVTAALAAPAHASGWSIQLTPNPSGGGALDAVSCPSSHTCFAVGASSVDTALAERWNGTAWTIQTTPATSNGVGSLNAVSCTAANACIAVGSMGEVTLAERWNGTALKIQPTPNPGGSQVALTGVSCTSASACTAVGRYFSGTGIWQTLAERWNGSAWTIQPSATPRVDSVLDGVSCTTASNCTAVGIESVIGCGVFHCRIEVDIAEQWNGTGWALDASGLPAARSSIGLSAVSCLGTSACTGVGHLTNSTFAAGWNGTTWATQSTQNPSTPSELSGVSCTTTTTCIAVGEGNGTLAEELTGTTWTIQPTPNPSAAASSYLASVSCPASTACIAVGNYTNASGTTLTLAEGYSV